MVISIPKLPCFELVIIHNEARLGIVIRQYVQT